MKKEKQDTKETEKRKKEKGGREEKHNVKKRGMK